MDKKNVFISFFAIVGIALLFVLNNSTVVNQRSILSDNFSAVNPNVTQNFQSKLSAFSNENLEILSEKLVELKIETIVNPDSVDSKEVKMGDTVVVNYRGWLASNGTLFDTSLGRSPFKFTVGQGTIEGFYKGVLGMRLGEVRRVKIPSDLGYGALEGNPSIPPNSDLIFDIELLEIL